MIKKDFIIILLVLIALPAKAALIDIGVVPFRTETGARPLGMGGAFVAAAEDVNSCFLNPGGLPWSKGIALNLENFENVSACQAYPTGFGQTLGIGFYKSTISGIPTGTGESFVADNILILSIGTKASVLPWVANDKIAQNTGVGLNLKILTGQTLGQTGLPDRTARGVELDVGALYKYNRWINIGGTLINLLPASADLGGLVWNDNVLESAPLSLKLGVSAKVIGDVWSPYYWEDQILLVNSDLEISRALGPSLFLGTEYNLKGQYFLRGGMYGQPQRGGMSMGAGLRQSSWGADFALFSEAVKGGIIYQFSFLYFPEEWAFERKVVKVYPPIAIQDPIFDITPADDLTTFDEMVWVKGAAKADVTVEVNGREVFLDSDLNFAVQIPLRIGKNLVLIEGYHGDGKIAIERKILRKAKVVISEEQTLKQQAQAAYTVQQKKVVEEKQKAVERSKEKVENLVTMGVVEVSAEKPFSLEAPISRGELTAWLVKAANIPLPKVTYDLFKDVLRSHPQAPYIKAAVDRGLIRGFPDGTFRPDSPISEAEGREVFKKFGIIK